MLFGILVKETKEPFVVGSMFERNLNNWKRMERELMNLGAFNCQISLDKCEKIRFYWAAVY